METIKEQKVKGEFEMSFQRLDTVSMLEEKLAAAKDIRLYGAGYYLNFFLGELGKLSVNYREKIKCIMVSDVKKNPASVQGIPIVSYKDEDLTGEHHFVFLTLGHRFAGEVYGQLEEYGCSVFEIDFNMFQREAYLDMEQIMHPFIEEFPHNTLSLDQPVQTSEIMAWTCWWQGEEQAPELVKICIASQRKNLPQGVRHIVITQDNYSDYIRLPQHIIDKVQSGDITYTTLSDILRNALLYKYGGFWMDSTILVLKPLDSEILQYPFYTRNIPETQYCTSAMWAGWFMYGKPGNPLFQFVSEGFYYYYSKYDKIKYYFTIDYLIALACNRIPGVQDLLKAVPYNNEKAAELLSHLTEQFDEARYNSFIKGTTIQKLSYKFAWKREEDKENSVYSYLKNTYFEN